MVAAALDPRTKELTVFGSQDKEKILKLVENYAMVVATEATAAVPAGNDETPPVFDDNVPRAVRARAEEYRSLLNFNNLTAPVEQEDEADGADDLVLCLPNNGRNQTASRSSRPEVNTRLQKTTAERQLYR